MNESELKKWLDQAGKDRRWLAHQCGVSKATVDGWLSAGRKIPAPAAKLISRLVNGPDTLNPTLSMREFLAAQRAATTAGLTLDEWIARLIREEIHRQQGHAADLTGSASAPHPLETTPGNDSPLVAEESGPYTTPAERATPGEISPSASSSEVA